MFSFIARALKGEQLDYTKGSLPKAIIMLAIPMIIEMGMESVFGVVDLFFVSKLGKHAISTAGLTKSVLTLVYSIAIGMSMGATAMVARRIGKKNIPGAAVATMQSMWLIIVVALIVSVAGLFFAEHILQLMGAGKETVAIVVFGCCKYRWLIFLPNN